MKRRALLIAVALLLLAAIIYTPSSVRAYSDYADLMLDTFAGHIMAYWPLDETSGTTAYDISGNGKHGTYSGVTLDYEDAPGALGRAGFWDGVNDVVTMPALARNTSGSVLLWAHMTGTTGLYRTLIQTGRAYMQYNGVSSFYYFKIYSANANSTNISKPTEWVFLALTWEADSVIGYEGTEVRWNLESWSPSALGTYNVYLGDDSGTPGAPFKGGLSQVIILDRVATPEEIAIASDPDPIVATNTPTATSTATVTNTPRPPELIATLQNGNQWELDYRITAGDITLSLLGLIMVGLLVFFIIHKLVRR